MFSSFHPGLGTEQHSQDIQMKSCSVPLVDIKKEKPFYSEDEQRTRTRAKYQATDVIGKAPGKPARVRVSGLSSVSAISVRHGLEQRAGGQCLCELT